MARTLSNFVFFKNTPFNDFQNTIHFDSNTARDDFFLKTKPYETLVTNEPYNFKWQLGHVNVPFGYEDLYGVNYCTFIDDDKRQRFYAFVVGYTWHNPEVTEVTLVIDTVMTFTQGRILNAIGPVDVKREHLDIGSYNAYLPYITRNDDLIKTHSKRYVYNNADIFKNMFIVFQSTAGLNPDEWGTEDDPKLPMAEGQTYDRITSPVGLYCAPRDSFMALIKTLKNRPWIAQNLKQVMMIPEDFIDKEDLVDSESGIDGVNKFKNNTVTSRKTFGKAHSVAELAKIMGIDYEKEPHLFRAEYGTIELFSWDGQAVYLDPAYLDVSTGLVYDCLTSIGYFNQIAIYPKNYQTYDSEQDSNGVNKGTFLNNAIIYNTFNEVPIYVDNFALSKAQGAHRRELAESKLLSGRAKNIVSGTDPQSRIMDAISLTTQIGGSMMGQSMGAGAFGKIGGAMIGGTVGGAKQVFNMYSDEYEFYRNQKAEFADMALQAPTINGQANGTAFQISTNTYGVTLKVSAPIKQEMDKVRLYYNTFGFQLDMRKELAPISSMSMMNFVQFDGNWHIDGVDVALMEQLKAQFANGMKLWRPNGNMPDPFIQDLKNNTRLN